MTITEILTGQLVMISTTVFGIGFVLGWVWAILITSGSSHSPERQDKDKD